MIHRPSIKFPVKTRPLPKLNWGLSFNSDFKEDSPYRGEHGFKYLSKSKMDGSGILMHNSLVEVSYRSLLHKTY